MTTRRFDRFALAVAATGTRCAAVAVLGAGLVAGAKPPTVADAGKTAKRARKRCTRQRGPCLEFTRDFCQGSQDIEACEEARAPCCNVLAKCNFIRFVTCFDGDMERRGSRDRRWSQSGNRATVGG